MAEVGGVSDLPPADWYADPEDSEQYRYWDGGAWTDHRAPVFRRGRGGRGGQAGRGGRAATGSAVRGMRPAWQVVSASFALIKRRGRDCALVTLAGWAGALVAMALLYFGTREVIPQLAEILNTFSDPDFDWQSPEAEAYFESIDFDVSGSGVLLTLAAAALFAAAALGHAAAAARLTLCDLTGRRCDAAEALRRAARRLPRVIGVALLLAAVYTAILTLALLLVTVALVLGAGLVIVVVLAAIAAAVLPTAIFNLALVTASTGPAEPSLICAFRLVRGAFWGTLGRILLVIAVVQALSFFATGTVQLAGLDGWPLWFFSFGVAGPAADTAAAVGATVLYYDRGGELG